MLSTAIYEQKSQIDWAVITQQIIPFKFYLFWISSNNLINQVNMDTSFGKPSTNSSFIVLLYPFRFNNGIVLFNSNLVKALHRSGFQSIVKIIDKKLHIQISSKLITFLPSRRFPLVLSARLFLFRASWYLNYWENSTYSAICGRQLKHSCRLNIFNRDVKCQTDFIFIYHNVM